MKVFSFFIIRYKLLLLGASENCMPLDIFSLSNRLEKLYPDERVQGILDRYITHDSAFVRRAMICTIDSIGNDFARKNIEILRSHLQDDDAWVSYDAIWALSKLKGLSDNDRVILATLAKPYISYNKQELEALKPASSSDYRAKMAAEVLLA